MAQRICPACNKTYGPDYADEFCECGVELARDWSAAPLPDGSRPPSAPFVVGGKEPVRPPAGTPCLVLFDADKKPLHYFPLTKDATLLGREDPVDGIFPDIDLRQWLDDERSRTVSRRHALILRARASNTFAIRPIAGNSGTQIEADMVPALEDMPLTPGTRIILGGTVRLKFEIT